MRRARAPFTVRRTELTPEGSYVIPVAQAFRGYLADLLEPQNYPDLLSGTTQDRRSGPTTSWVGR